jgi:AraC family transcriptional activator of pobA
MAIAEIHTYNLFGEAGDLPDVVHCETIAERSQLHDWEFAPHRHARLHQVLLVETGGGTARLEGRIESLIPGFFVNVPIGAVHGFSFQEGTEGWVVTLEGEVIDEMLRAQEGLRPVLAQLHAGPAAEGLNTLMKNIFAEYHGRRFARAHLLRAVAAELLGLVARHLHEVRPDREEAGDLALLRRFETLVDRHFAEHWRVGDYASALAVSATHLSRTLRLATGQPASKLIEARLIREARRQLVYTNLSVAQIAYALGYIDPAYFSRVFSRATGLAPKAFRERQAETAPS